MIARLLGRLPLALRAPLLAAALMAPMGLMASQLALSALARAQEARLAELARLHVDGLSVALGPAVLRRDVWEVYDTLDRAANASDGRRMRLTAVADDAGRVLAASDPLRAPTDGPLSALTEGAQPLDAVALSADASIRLLAPLDYQGRTVGAILTELDVSDLVAERRRAALLLLLLGNGLATAALALAGYVAMRRALRPVAQLSGRMGAAGGAPAPIPDAEIPAGDTEVARLFGAYNGMVGAIAARAEAERRLAERERLVSLGRLASSLAHEINNPLGGMLAAVDTVERYAERPDTVRASAALLARGLRRLRDVARAALDHDRLEDAAPLAAQDIDDLRLLVSPETARLDQSLGWVVSADDAALAALPAAKVRQIALNLLLNASAAAGRGGAVSLALEAAPEGVRLIVRDDGPGLEPAARERLLGDGPAPEGGGLGLRITRDLVRGLGGRIEHAREGGLTSIAVAFPRSAVEAAA